MYGGGVDVKARVDITSRCNLNCLHCGAAQYRTPMEWTTEEAFRAFDDMISHGIKQIDFLGGEPFIREDIMELFSHLNDQGISILIVTNGLLLNEDTIDALVNLKRLGMVSFSIDGASKEVYETIRGRNHYEKMLANLKALVSRKKETESRFNVGLTCVVNGVNASETDALITLADRFGLNNISFLSTTWFGNAEKNKEKLYIDPLAEFAAYERAIHEVSRVNKIRAATGRRPLVFSIDSTPSTWKYYFIKKYPLVCQIRGKFRCQAGTGTVHVDASGVVYPCEAVKIQIESIEAEIGKYERMSLPEHWFEEIINSESFKKTIEYVQNKKHLCETVTPCNSCKYSDGCSVCPLHAQSEKIVHWCTGDIMKTVC